MADPIKYDGVEINLRPDDPTTVTLRKITDWIDQFRGLATPTLTVGMIYGMLKNETSSLFPIEEEASEDSLEVRVEGEVEWVDADGSDYIQQIINVGNGGTHIVNNYYYSESEKSGE